MILKSLRFLSLLMACLCLISCGDDNDETELLPTPPSPGEGLTFALSHQVIQANGEDKTDFIVKFDGLKLEDGYTIYNEKDEPIENSKSFSTTEAGEYQFWATYKSSHTDKVTVKAISIPVPQLPQDPAPERTDFTKRVMLTQFTGTGCGYCPVMTSSVKEALSDVAYAEKAVWCVAHTFNRTDPAYLTDDRLAQAFGISSYPSINIDFLSSFNNTEVANATHVRSIIDQAYQHPANAGISAKAELIDNEKIALHIAVKAAKEGVYSVGAWLMEDSIKGKQSNYTGIEGDFDTHNNALRITDSKAGFNDYTGIPLGRIEEGKTAEHVFILSLKDKWVLENCHLAIFVAEHKDRQVYVSNVVSCPIEGDLVFDYKK